MWNPDLLVEDRAFLSMTIPGGTIEIAVIQKLEGETGWHVWVLGQEVSFDTATQGEAQALATHVLAQAIGQLIDLMTDMLIVPAL